MMISLKIRTKGVANAIGASVDVVIYVLLGCMQKTFLQGQKTLGLVRGSISWSEMHHFHKRGRYE